MLAHVVQLLDHDDAGPGVATGVGEAPERLDDRVVAGAEVAACQDRGPMDRHRLHDDHPDAAQRPLTVVADVPLAR